ncbi:MAG: hypothetical protein OIN85_09840 [Candidatus Methanoperedens sp.]|nr:hypothetical protein [Candidatus Methanoperedens sp.]
MKMEIELLRGKNDLLKLLHQEQVPHIQTQTNLNCAGAAAIKMVAALERNNELTRTEMNSGSASSYGVSTSSLLNFFHT